MTHTIFPMCWVWCTAPTMIWHNSSRGLLLALTSNLLTRRLLLRSANFSGPIALAQQLGLLCPYFPHSQQIPGHFVPFPFPASSRALSKGYSLPTRAGEKQISGGKEMLMADGCSWGSWCSLAWDMSTPRAPRARMSALGLHKHKYQIKTVNLGSGLVEWPQMMCGLGRKDAL